VHDTTLHLASSRSSRQIIEGKLVRRFAIVLATTGFVLAAAASPAWAHVEVEPSSATKGSDAVLAFIVPNEKEDATTTKVVVQFPRDHPIAEALVEATPGWTAESTPLELKTPIDTEAGPLSVAVDKITWTATGAGIAVENFGEFRVSVGLPKDADSLSFPTTQTYSDGVTVNWVQEAVPGGPEPDEPAPVLTLTNPESDNASPAPAAAATTTASDDDDSAKTIAIIAIIVGGLGFLAGIGGLARSRRRT
jgi:uncharacterized protein YcnI